MKDTSIVAPPMPKAQEKLAAMYPEEISFFKERFLWSSQNSGFYVRQAYEPIRTHDGLFIPKWRPFKTRGRWQPLYGELVDSLAEKHLEFERFCRICDDKNRLRPYDNETAFWVGTMAGPKTYTHCIDLDSHDQIGWTWVPSRWHDGRTESGSGPYDHRYLPVVRPSLRFFMIAKVVHDHIPNRIWSFSSANLGLAVWKIVDSPNSTEIVFDWFQEKLDALGLGRIEHYPRPARMRKSFGKCHRRPCGMDTAIITSSGLLTEPIQQVRAFMRPPETPSFERILETYWEKLGDMYASFLDHGGGPDHERLDAEQRKLLVQDCLEVVEQVKDWVKLGCPIDRELIEQGWTKDVKDPDQADVPAALPQNQPSPSSYLICGGLIEPGITSIDEPQEDRSAPESFLEVDLTTVSASGQWVQFIKFLVENGFPAEDRFLEVISSLAKWFGFVELFGQDRDQIKQLLHRYVVQKHNGKITRWTSGDEAEVLRHVDRIVDSVLDNEDDHGKRLFAELRQKRSSGRYSEVYRFEPQIWSGSEERPSLPNPISPSSYFICGGLIESSEGPGEDAELDQDDRPEWIYEPDLTPLPPEVMDRIQRAFKARGRQLRQNRQSGRYPTLDAITKFFNFLFSGRKPGTRRASQILLGQMGFATKSTDREPIIKILENEGLLRRGGYASTSLSRLWMLDRTVLVAMSEARSPCRRLG